MKKTKILSLLLCLSLFCALIVPGTRAYADNEPDSGMKISKTATANNDGSYTITLEAFAIGSKVITEQKTDIPTDIVLVIDQSGSMAENMTTYSFRKYTGKSNGNFYSLRHNGGSKNLYYLLDNGSYVTVSVTKQETLGHIPLGNLKNYTVEYSWSGVQLTTDCYYYYANNLYEKVEEEYKKVSLTRKWIRTGFLQGYYQYTYTFSNGDSILSDRDEESPNLDPHTPLYTGVVDATYTYTYTDKDGVTQTIGTSTGADTQPTEFTLYERYQSGSTRLEALKDAVTNFADAVAKKAAGADKTLGTDDDVNHRIAVVGYADTDWDYGYNTGVFIGSTLNRYENNAAGVYSTALQDMSTTNGKSNVAASLNALQASGATRTDYGLIMAKGILDANPVPTGETRNRVVIVFTDGSPTDYNGFQRNVANSAISTANAIKAEGTTVYSIGIFSGADASTAGKEPDKDYEGSGWSANYTEAEMSAACNWFMQKVSSNNGTPRTPSYYLSAGDEVSLNNIFQQISDQIETGGSSSTLTSEAVVKDIISPQFTLPEGATANNITLETYTCTGKNGDAYRWTKNADAMGATASISGDQVSVTGFNFSDNYVGTVTENGNTSYRGNKLVISFKVQPKAGFLGGNEVYTNTSAGIYENGSAENPLLTFDRPTVNVPIKDVTVTAEDKNVYLLNDVTAEQLKTGSTVNVGNVELNLGEENYGLESWQTQYVEITVKVKDKDGNVIPTDGLKNLAEDTTYTIEVTVAPTTTGSTTAKTGTSTPAAKINLFKPELTFKDSTAYYGESVPENNNYSGNVGSETWKHGDTVSTNVTMLGTKPTLDISFTPDESKLKDGKYTKQDVPVAATVKIGTENVNDYTTFVHQDCTTACGWETPATPGAPAFLIHIQTCQLTITKEGGAADESYVFVVKKDGQPYSEVTVWGNGTETLVELPIGTYTVEEDTGWSWRFTGSNGSAATLSAQNPTGSITATNEMRNPYWLNGFSQVVRNIFGISH